MKIFFFIFLPCGIANCRIQIVYSKDMKLSEPLRESGEMAGEKQESNCGCGEGKVPDREGKCVMPEVTFSAFVMSLNTSVLFHLGEIVDPATGERVVDLELARHGIDTLELIQNKTKGNLSSDEEEMLKNILYDIKLRFVKAIKK